MPPEPPVPPASYTHPLFALVGMQTLGMYTDTLLKMVVVLILVGPEPTEAAQQAATFHGFLAYTLPFVALSLLGGSLADRWGKRRTLVALKVLEIGVMVVAGFALWTARPWLVLAVLTMLGILSALASPSKYGLLPELLPEGRLARANGLFVLVTWLATIVGTGMAGWALDLLGPDRRWQLGVATGALAVIGLLFTLRIPHVAGVECCDGVRATAREGWGEIVRNRSLRLAVFGSIAFWTLGALLQQDVIVYSKSELRLSDTGVGLMTASLAVGIGVGGLACGFLTRGHLGTRWVERGAAAMGVVLAVLGTFHPDDPVASGLLIFLLGVTAGFIVVPLNALAQGRSPPKSRGAVIAVLNVFVFTGILLGSLSAFGLGTGGGYRSTAIFLVAAGVAFVGAFAAAVSRRRMEAAPAQG